MKYLALILCTIATFQTEAQQFISTNTRLTTSPRQRLQGRGLAAGATTSNSNTVFDVKVLGLGGANDITGSDALGGNLALGAYMKIEKRNTYDNKWYTRHAFYLMFNARAGNTSDTNVVAKTFLFPDIAKRDFTLGYEFLMYRQQSPFQFIPFVEFSWTRNVLTTGKDSSATFHCFNLMFGPKFILSKTFSIGEDNNKQFGFTFYPYYQLVSVDPKDFTLRNEMLNEENLPPTFHTIGLYGSLQIAQLGLFANYKRILNNSEEINNRDLKGGILVIGALISADIFRF